MSDSIENRSNARITEVDVAIIGAGTAGLVARRTAKAAGASVVMVDPGPYGTTCARVGCMPSKLLIAAADAAHRAREADVFGVSAKVDVDGQRVMERVRRERDRFTGFAVDVIEQARAEGELLSGRAQIERPGILTTDTGHEVHYRRLVVATGSRPFVPPPFRGLTELMLTNEDVFELEQLPESLLVVGLGVIGLELGQAMHRLGVRTTLLGMGGMIGPLSDPDVLEEARGIFSDALDLHPDYQLETIEPTEGGARIRFTDSRGRSREEVFERILMAAGRTPNLDGLGLERLGVSEGDADDLPIDPDTLQLAEAPVFIAGDVNELHPLLHEATDDGKIAGENAARYPQVKAAQRRTPLTIVFSDPQIALVGQSYADLDACEAMAGEVDYGKQGRARVQAEHRGKVRIYADRRTSRLVGAELVGPRVEHLAHLLAWAVQAGMTVDTALAMPFYHPVVEEGLRTALRDLNTSLRHGEPIKCRVSEMGVGS